MSRALLKSTSIFSVMTLLSRILGFLRDMIVAHVFGATGTTDAFYVAFKIPNFMRRLFAEGSFSQAFVPVLAQYKEQRSQQELKDFVNHISGTLGGILFAVTLIGVIAAPLIIMLFSPGFTHDSTRFELASSMLRITFPYLLFISLTAFAGGILNTHNHFAGPALTPIFLNISMIMAALWLAPHFQHPIIALAWGVFFGGIVQLLFQYPFLKHFHLVPRFKWMWRDAGVQRVIKLMLPAMFGVSVAQISMLVDTMFGSFLPAGSISWLYNSERLMEFPLGIFGVALATVILPHLARKHAAKLYDEYDATMNWALQNVLFIGIPAAIGLAMLAGPLLTSLFNYGHFNQFDVIMSRESTIAYAMAIPFMMLVKILASGFYARQDIKTPVKIAVVALVCNIVLKFLLIGPFKHAGLAFSSAVSALINASILCFFLMRKNYFKPNKTWWVFLFRITTANVAMVGVLYFATATLATWFAWHWQQRFIHLFLLLFAAMIAYLGTVILLGFRFNRKA